MNTGFKEKICSIVKNIIDGVIIPSSSNRGTVVEVRRGALVVLEGLDCSGKSLQPFDLLLAYPRAIRGGLVFPGSHYTHGEDDLLLLIQPDGP
jgi:hypothetical protein